MAREDANPLRRGWTTGACAAAAARAAFAALLTGEFPDPVTIRLPRRRGWSENGLPGSPRAALLGRTTATTSAPRSASMRPASGPGPMPSNSMTLRPASGRIIVGAPSVESMCGSLPRPPVRGQRRAGASNSLRKQRLEALRRGFGDAALGDQPGHQAGRCDVERRIGAIRTRVIAPSSPRPWTKLTSSASRSSIGISFTPSRTVQSMVGDGSAT